MSEIKIGENSYGEELYLYAEVVSDGLWIEIESPDGPDIGACVSGRDNLEELAKLVAQALEAALLMIASPSAMSCTCESDEGYCSLHGPSLQQQRIDTFPSIFG